MAAAAGVVVLVFLKSSYQMVEAENGVSAIFVFGDSLVDVGNNNFLHSAARANYYPYGVDFTDGPTGRFSNGRTVIDMFGTNIILLTKFFSLKKKEKHFGD